MVSPVKDTESSTRARARLIVFAIIIFVIAVIALGKWAITPSAKEKAYFAEQRRIQCLDSRCEGDVAPGRRPDQVVQKINGHWYVGPREYFNGFGQLNFEWWQHRPLQPDQARPPEAQALAVSGKGYAFAVQVFFTGRQRWPDPKLDISGSQDRLERTVESIQLLGYKNVDRISVSADLDRIRFLNENGVLYRREFYVAKELKDPLNALPPVVDCDAIDKSYQLDRCTGGFFWKDDVYVDYRIPAQSVNDWPEICKEIIRVLSLLQKVQ